MLSPAKLTDADDNGTALVAVAQVLGGGFWAKAMALSIALSVIATTGTGIVLSARIVYGMASYRVLPEFLGTVSRRYATPVASSIIVGLLIVILSAVYYLATSVQNAFFDVIDVTGLLFSIFYILTALAAIVYYRRRIVSSAWDFVTVGLLPLGAAGFLGWIFVKSLGEAPWSQRWSLIGIVIAGLALMFFARFVLRSPFFQIPRESEVRRATAGPGTGRPPAKEPASGGPSRRAGRQQTLSVSRSRPRQAAEAAASAAARPSLHRQVTGHGLSGWRGLVPDRAVGRGSGRWSYAVRAAAMSPRWRSAQPTRAASESCSSRAISVAVYSTFGGTVG